jgi:CrcB protein
VTTLVGKLLAIGSGGFIGALLRYATGGLVHRMLPNAIFPWGTMVVNILGCLIIGLGGGLIENRQMFTPEMRAFLFIGILGSFTTFSTFGLETFNLAKEGQVLASLANVGLSVMIGLLAVLAGNLLSRWL